MLGHDSKDSHLPIVQLLLLFNLEDKEPSYYSILSGSITSVMSISATMEETPDSIPPAMLRIFRGREYTTSFP